jgi:hypothetical protein
MKRSMRPRSTDPLAPSRTTVDDIVQFASCAGRIRRASPRGATPHGYDHPTGARVEVVQATLVQCDTGNNAGDHDPTTVCLFSAPGSRKPVYV